MIDKDALWKENQNGYNAGVIVRQTHINQAIQAERVKHKAECDKCEYDPQAAMFGWFLKQGWLPPNDLQAERAKVAGEILNNMNMRDVGGINPEWALSDKQRNDFLAKYTDGGER